MLGRLINLALATMLFASTASVAIAAEGTATAPPAGETQVQVWPGALAGQVVVIVSIVLPDDQDLPATVRLPVVEGMSVDWAGEIAPAGGEDAQRQYKLVDGTGGQYAEFEVIGSRQAQIELSGLPLATEGGRVEVSVDFVQTVEGLPGGVTAFSVRVPAAASDVQIDPAPTAAPERNEAGEALYTLPSAALDPGQGRTIQVSYGTGSAAPATGAQGGGIEPVVGVLLALLGIAVVALVLMMKRQRRAD